MEITAEIFEKATGNKPAHDDLDRCNCEKAGELGHFYCGWCSTTNQPVFLCPDHFGVPAHQRA